MPLKKLPKAPPVALYHSLPNCSRCCVSAGWRGTLLGPFRGRSVFSGTHRYLPCHGVNTVEKREEIMSA